MSGSFSVFARELKLAWSGGGGAALPVGFFAAACSITPFAVGNGVENLKVAGPGVMWIALALASLLPMERLFQAATRLSSVDLPEPLRPTRPTRSAPMARVRFSNSARPSGVEADTRSNVMNEGLLGADMKTPKAQWETTRDAGEVSRASCPWSPSGASSCDVREAKSQSMLLDRRIAI